MEKEKGRVRHCLLVEEEKAVFVSFERTRIEKGAAKN